MPPRNFLYSELIKDNESGEPDMSPFPKARSACLTPVEDAFRENIHRTMFFQFLPSELAFQGRRDAIFQSNASAMEAKRPGTSLKHFTEQEGTALFLELFKAQVQDFESQPPKVKSMLMWKIGVEYVERLAGQNEGMAHSMDAIFQTIVMDSWTAYECLAAEVWAEVVNRGPMPFRTKVMRNARAQRESNVAQPEATIDPLVDFARSYLEDGMVSLQSFPKIQKNFGMLMEKADRESAFGDMSLKVLAAVRNIFAHKAGVADAKFLRDAKEFEVCGQKPFFALLEKQRVFLDGRIVKELRCAAIRGAELLLKFADDVISPLRFH